MCEQIVLNVHESDENTRLDTFVSSRLKGVSRSTVKRWIDSDRVKVEKIPRKASYRVSGKQTVQVSPLPPEPSEVIPEEIPIDIVFEDSDYLVINKPAGMVVHPGAGNWTGTLANALAFRFASLSHQRTLRPGIIHRLDKGTSGVMVVAKNDFAHEVLSKQFQERITRKEYLTLVYGEIKDSKGKISVPIGRDIRHRTKISVRSKSLKPAITSYEVIRRYPGSTYCRVFPKTGRTHQIRVHFAYLGYPVVGDDDYATNRYRDLFPAKLEKRVRKLDRLFLHATRLSFLHPRSKEEVTYSAELPAELADFLLTLGE